MKRTTTMIVMISVICAALTISGCVSDKTQSEEKRNLSEITYPITMTFGMSEGARKYNRDAVESDYPEFTVTLHAIATSTGNDIIPSRTTWKTGTIPGVYRIMSNDGDGMFFHLDEDGSVLANVGIETYKGPWK